MSLSCNSGPELVAAALFARVRSSILRIGGITILIAVCALAGSSPRAATQATPAPSPERVCGVCCCQDPDFCPLGQTCPTSDPCFTGVRCDVATQFCKQTFVPNGVPCDNNSCPNIRSDPNNCGACDAVCPSSGAGTFPVCRNGRCQVVTVPFAANDVAPPTSAGDYSTEPSGRIIEIQGNDAALYAISVDGSMWKSTNSAPWFQLTAAPPLSFSLAIDPQNPSHLVVGERDGLGPPRLNTAGAWESTDAGASWTKVFDSASQCPRFRESKESSQAIRSVLITPASTVLLGTSCGVFKKGRFCPTRLCIASYDRVLPAAGVTAAPTVFGLVASAGIGGFPGPNVVFARTGLAEVSMSTDEGTTWKSNVIPSALPRAQDLDPLTCDPDHPCGAPSACSGFTGFGTIAVVTGDPELFHLDNFTPLVYFDINTRKSWVQRLQTHSGQGLAGGLNCLRALPAPDAPLGRDFFFLAGEETLRWQGRFLVDLQGNLMLDWGTADFATPSGSITCSPCTTPVNIHADIRNAAADPASGAVWFATDGGVFVRRNGTWSPQIEGLHTASIATLTVWPRFSPPPGFGNAPRLAYSGPDNDSWYGDLFTDDWHHTNVGDTSWTAGDAGDPNLVIGARSLVLSDQGGPLEELHFFYPFESPPGAQIGGFSGYNDAAAAAFFGRNSVQIIQTPPGEPAVDLLDAVSLVIPPITFGPPAQRQPVNGLLGLSNPNPNGGAILLRTKTFAANPGVNIQNYCGPTSPWYPEVVKLPPNTIRVWPSGGHSNPTYYVYDNVNVSKITCFTQRSRTDCSKGTCADFQEQITPLNVGGTPLRVPKDNPPPSGPVFVDPYDPNHVFVATSDNGVTVSVDGGTTPFKPDPVLTALLTDSGHFPLLVQGQGRTYLNEVSFDRNRSHSVVASSPFTGAFWAADDERIWVALSPALSHPAVSVTDVGIDPASIYIGTQGRGIISVSGYQNGPIASFYDRTASGGGITGTKLLRSDGKALAGALVSILVTQSDGTQTTQNVTTASDGLLKVTEPPPFSIVHLSFAGLLGVAPANTAFETGPTL
jgi:hypothetical protein